MKRAIAMAAFVALAGCGHRPGNIQGTVNEANALFAEGRIEEAAKLMQAAASDADTPVNHDDLLFQLGLMYARARMVEEAFAVWDPLYESTGLDAIQGRIVFEKGMLMRAVGELDQAEHWFTLMIVEHPTHGLTDTALLRLQMLVRDRAGDEAERALLEKLLPGALESTFGDDVLWALYVWHHEHGQDATAKQYLLAIRKSYPYPTGGRIVESLFALADMAEAEKDWKEAEMYLTDIIGPIGKSVLIGGSSGSSKAKALFKLGRIYEKELGDPETAMDMYMMVVKMEDLETVSDDGLIEVARVLMETGEMEKACEKLEELFDGYPYSNKRKKAQKMAVEAGCEDIEP